MKTKVFYSHNQDALDLWLLDNREKIEIVGMAKKYPKNIKGRVLASTEEITIYYKEKE
jgi:hypothetical protein